MSAEYPAWCWYILTGYGGQPGSSNSTAFIGVENEDELFMTVDIATQEALARRTRIRDIVTLTKRDEETRICI